MLYNGGEIQGRIQLGMVVHAYIPSYSGGRGRRNSSSRPAWAKLRRPYLKKQNTNKRAGE
jgi:hypothetical protein